MKVARLLLVALLLLLHAAPAAAGGIITVVVTDPPQTTQLRLQPNFITVLRFDAPIQTVAVGNGQLLVIEVVGPQGQARDVVLKPRESSGTTDLKIWVGSPLDTVISLWEVTIDRKATAALVFIVTRGAAEKGPTPTSQPAPPPPAASKPPTSPPASSPASSPGASPPAAGETRAPSTLPAPTAAEGRTVASLMTQIEQEGVTISLQAIRLRSGAAIRYRLRNDSQTPYTVVPARIAVWANGQAVRHLLVRTTASPDVLEPGQGETGVIMIEGDVKDVRLLFPLFPSASTVGTKSLPVVFEANFSGLDQVQLSP
jgi:hypothetical protein